MNKFLSSLLISLSLFSISYSAEAADDNLDDSFVKVSGVDLLDRSSESGKLSLGHLSRLKKIAVQGEDDLNQYLKQEFGNDTKFWKILFR